MDVKEQMENLRFCNSHMQVAGFLPKKEKKYKKEKDTELFMPCDGRLKFADRLRALLKKENTISYDDDDDPFNSDDPYAFPDPVAEQENGCTGFSHTPILRTPWNNAPRAFMESAYSDCSSKPEQAMKNGFADGKTKATTPKLSKTVSRLHAKIAQNKILDKQKKTQDSSHSVLLMDSNFSSVTNIKTEPLSPVETASISNESSDLKINTDTTDTETHCVKSESNTDDYNDTKSILSDSFKLSDSPLPYLENRTSVGNSCPSSVLNSLSSESILSQDRSSSCSIFSTTEDVSNNVKMEIEETVPSYSTKVPLVLHQMYKTLSHEKKENYNILTFESESSESEESGSEEENQLFSHLSRFCNWDRRNYSTFHTKSASRQFEQMQLKSQMQSSYQQLRRLHMLHKQEVSRCKELVQPIIDAARSYPDPATDILLKHSSLLSKQKAERTSGSGKKICCYRKNTETCNHLALPYTWHCRKHITYNVDQLLFQHCTAKYPDNTQCCVPVFDVVHELPLCEEHAKKRDNYHKMALEPKPKKPRKKPKPSALTRPPKRGKKKKRPSLLRPSMPLPPLSQAATVFLNMSSPSKITVEISNHPSYTIDTIKTAESVLSTAVISRDLKGQIDSELGSDLEEQFSPGAIEKSLDLPLDAAELANQASKLLEEHDFTEVLNKIPDDAFNDLFVDTRNGEYIPSREETEELERALAAVSKDVHLAKASLAKLSSGTGSDYEELERTIEMHGSLLGADNMTSAIDEHTFPELTHNLNVITSNFSTSDLNSLTQALSSIAPENIDQSHLPAVSENHLTQNSNTVPVLTSDIPHPHVLNGHTTVAGIHPLHVDPNFTPHLLESALNQGTSEVNADGRVINNSHLAAILFGLGQASATAVPQTFSTGSNLSEDANLMSTPGGLTSTHWLLNSSDQVLTLSHMAYQNGFIVTSQANSPYNGSPLLGSIGKFPLQALTAEVSLVSSTPLVTSASCSDSAICGDREQSISVNHSSRPVTLQQNNTTAVIVQEGAS